MTKYNYDFKVRDLRATKSKHRVQIQKSKNVPYSEIIDYYAEDNISSDILGSTQWHFRYMQSKNKLNKTLVKELKSLVNYKTREYIGKALVYRNYPKSWDTAFYVSHKTKVDALMKRVVKELMRHFPRGK